MGVQDGTLFLGVNMKKITLSLLALTLAFALLLSVGCTETEGEVFLGIDKKYDVRPGDTLEDYMDWLEEKGKLDYEEEDGMVLEINGIKNSLNSYWMLYTDDPNNSNSAWGTYEYKGKVLYSATYGVEQLKINKDYVYVFVYQTF